MKSCELSCIDCALNGCAQRDGEPHFPEFCLSRKLSRKTLERVTDIYNSDPQARLFAIASAQVENWGYLKATRVEETVEFAKRIGAVKIGIATCAGLINESRTFARILKKCGLQPFGVICKIGIVDKTEIGICPEDMERTGCTMCNPILQAELLNEEHTDLNVVIGLCVGHDSLFYRYSKAMCTTLVTKDRVLMHNPAAALYGTASFYSRLFSPTDSEH